MGFDYIRKIPTVEEILNELPVDSKVQEVKKERDKALIDIFTNKSFGKSEPINKRF